MIPAIFPRQWLLTMPAISACISSNWIVNILVTGVFPFAADKLKDRKELIFGSFVFIKFSLASSCSVRELASGFAILLTNLYSNYARVKIRELFKGFNAS